MRSVPIDRIASRLLRVQGAEALVSNDLSVLRIVLVVGNCIVGIVKETRIRVNPRVSASNRLVASIEPSGVELFCGAISLLM